ncbi:hypothetical protein [Caulobacter sp. Root1455]|uniref:hypothetical protein n=1 Tax=Caulobacter sp. Root1455 TaxID=1736465 RepID=UPI000A8C2741|nr:hypothetical protein [Caulobacter sp. Root1455]
MAEKAGSLVTPPSRARGLAAELVVVVLGLTLLAWAAAADVHWLDRHVLPDFYIPRERQVLILTVLRGLVAALGLALILGVRPRAGRLLARTTLRRLVYDAAPISLAVVLSMVASEFLLSRLPWLATQEVPAPREPLRRRDPRLGWVFIPSRQGVGRLGGRDIAYAFDASGHRVRRLGDRVDPERPTILFTGESVMVGHGLTWEESLPAQVEALTGVRSANLAVEGYATDQSYLRLRDEWPRYRRPVAVVALFMPALLRRTLDVDRPHLDADLTWRPPVKSLKLAEVARRAIPYRSERDIDRGVATSRAALADTVALARARGATPLILVPQLRPETPVEAALRRRVLDEAGLPYVVVRVDPGWLVPRNRHPDARASRAMAQAVAGYLAAQGAAKDSGNGVGPN